ncbi:hypothetical protein ACXWO5_10585, partial [Streptococcus pyogenes]
SARHAQEVAKNTFLHTQYTLYFERAAHPETDMERIVQENALDQFSRWKELAAITFADPTNLMANALQLLHAAQNPLSRKAL